MDNENSTSAAPPDAQQQQPSTSSMNEPQTAHGPVVDNEFLSTGRTGRRNALGDILDSNTAFLSTADLPDQLSALSFGSDPCAPSTSSGSGMYPGPSTSTGSATNAGASTSQQ